MKNIVKEVLLGFAVIIAITLMEFIVTIPFGIPGDVTDDVWKQVINRELLLTAIPAGVVTFLFAWILRTKSRAEALRKGAIWTAMLCVNYAVIGLGNDNFGLIFGSLGVYVLLVGAFAGPQLFAVLKKLT
jgi:hypothetical protein